MAKTKTKKEDETKKEIKKEKTPSPEQAAETKEAAKEQPKKKKEPKEGGALLTVLTLLLVLVGVGEMALLVYMGFGAYQGIRTQRAYEEQRASNSSTAPAVAQVSYAGPWLTIENGQVTWRNENSPFRSDLGSTATIPDSTGGSQDQDDYPRMPSSPPRSWIRTIDSDET